jgi:hypothetical protein
VTFPAPRHMRTQQTVCRCGTRTWNPDACDQCIAQRDDEEHAAAEHHHELYGWTGERWDNAADEYDADRATGMFDESAA